MKISFIQEKIWKFRRWARRFDKRIIELDEAWARKNRLKFVHLPCERIIAAWVEDNDLILEMSPGAYTIPEEGFTPEGLAIAKKLTEERPRFWW